MKQKTQKGLYRVQRGLEIAKWIPHDDSLNPIMAHPPIKAIGYIRVSTKQQAGDDRMGEAVQKQEIDKYAVLNGYEIVDWYIDEISGVKEERPALDEILFGDALEKSKAEAVIAYKSDRIARDIKLYFYYLYTLEKKNVKLVSVMEQFDDDQYGLSTVFRTLMLFVAEQERKNIMLRTSGGRKAKAAQGGYAGGKAPYGYQVERGKLIVDEKEAKIVRRIFMLYDANCTITEIANQINYEGYRTRNHKPFATGHISKILNNRPTYEGYYRYGNEKWVKGQHEAIMPRSLRKIPEIEMLNAELRNIVETGTSTPYELDTEDESINEANTLISEVPEPVQTEPEPTEQDNTQDNIEDNVQDKPVEPDPVIEEKPQIGADFDEMFAADIPEPEPESEESKPESDVNPKSTLDQPKADPLASIRRGVTYGNANRGVI